MGGSPGKLRAAAQWLFSDDTPQTPASPHERAEALRQIGVPEAQLAALRAEPLPALPDEPELLLWAWHADALDVLQFMQRQWRVTPTPWGRHHEGLDLNVLPVVERALGITATRELLEQLRTLEAEAASILNKASVYGR